MPDYGIGSGAISNIAGTAASATPWGAIAGVGLGLAGSIYGQYKAGQAQKAYENYARNSIKGRYADLEGTYNRRNSQDYLDTEAAKAMQKRFADYAKTTRENLQGQAVAAGATPEEQVAQQKNLGDSYNNMLDSLAEKSTAYKMQNQQAYDAAKLGLQNDETNMNLGILQSKISSGNNLASNFGAAGAGITNAWAEGAFKPKKA